MRKASELLLVVGAATAISFGLREGVIARLREPAIRQPGLDADFVSARPLISSEQRIGLITGGSDEIVRAMIASYSLAPVYVEPEQARDEWVIVEGVDAAAVANQLAVHKLIAVRTMAENRVLARRVR